jgi:hypothetical protein
MPWDDSKTAKFVKEKYPVIISYYKLMAVIREYSIPG